jgi:hypothetical protein
MEIYSEYEEDDFDWDLNDGEPIQAYPCDAKQN